MTQCQYDQVGLTDPPNVPVTFLAQLGGRSCCCETFVHSLQLFQDAEVGFVSLFVFIIFFAVTLDYTDIMKWLKLDEKWNFLSMGNTYVSKNVLPLWIGEAKVLVKWKFFSCEMLQGFVSEEYKGFVLITSKHKIYKAEWLWFSARQKKVHFHTLYE